MSKFVRVARLTPNWRRILYISLAVLCTYVTIIIMSGFIQYFYLNSVTLTALGSSLIDIIGNEKYKTIIQYFYLYSKLFILFIFLIFMYLFYHHEKKRQYMCNLKNIIKESSYIAAGEFQHEWTTYDNDLDELVKNMNNIVQQLKIAMEEERHLEHTKNELITNVSHDLRTPLTSIVGYLRLIEEDKYKDEIALRHYTGIAFQKSLQLEQLINELFEYTRMQDKRYELNKTPINVAEMLGQIIIQNELNFIQNDMICRESISDVDMIVLGDGERLARVFENLIINAIHYGKAGKYVDITAEELGNHIVVAVTNYGNQIPQSDLPYLFERFYRAEKSRAVHTGGSGLGLAIAKSVIEHHEGTIEANSNSERTSFIVRLNKIE